MVNMKGISVLWFWCVYFLCCSKGDGALGSTVTLEDISVLMKQKFDELDEFLHTSVSLSFADMQFELDVIKNSLKADVEGLDMRMGRLEDALESSQQKTVSSFRTELTEKLLESRQHLGNDWTSKQFPEIAQKITGSTSEIKDTVSGVTNEVNGLNDRINMMESTLQSSQNRAATDIKTNMTLEATEMIKEMDLQINVTREGLKDRLNMMESTLQSSQNRAATDIKTNMILEATEMIKGQLAELQGTSNVEEMEREFQRQTLNKNLNNLDQIANLQESFSTELKRIEHSISSKVSNLQDRGVAERELQRQTFTKNSNKIDQIANLQEFISTELKRIEPSISSKVSILQQAVAGCPTGFTNVPGAGCLKEIKYGKTFDDAITHCSTLGAQLVVPLVFQGLQDYVGGSLSGHHYWIGVRRRKWSTGRDVIQEEWHSGQPNGDVTECAFIKTSSLRIEDYGCGNLIWFICQLK